MDPYWASCANDGAGEYKRDRASYTIFMKMVETPSGNTNLTADVVFHDYQIRGETTGEIWTW